MRYPFPLLLLTVVALLGLCDPSRGQAPTDAALRARLDTMLTETFPADAPGAAVFVAYRGQVLIEKGYGLADVEAKSPITAGTNFDLASVSKQFTALALMLLADWDQLSFDDDIRKHLPELPARDGKRPIRIRDLLHHTSGLPDYTGFWRDKHSDFSRVTNDDVIDLIKDRPLNFEPGTKYEYSNSNYALMPMIVKRLTRKPFRDFLRDEVFLPLGMTRTVVVDDMSVVVPERAKGYRKAKGEWQRAALDGPICGDGNVFSNVHDLGLWEQAVTAGRLARSATWELAFAPGRLDDGKPTQYGFGWSLGLRNGKRTINHGGSWAGTRTYLGRWPDDRLTVVVLSNAEDGRGSKLRTAIPSAILR